MTDHADSTRRFAAGSLALAGALTASGAAAAPSSQTHSFELQAPCARLMPLFTAQGERAWAPGWEPEMLSGDTARGSVFRTRTDERETVWTVTDYRPEQGHVSYARIAQGSNMGLVDVDCRELPSGGSEVTVTYTLTALTPEGEALVRDFLEPKRYADFIGEWREAIAVHLKSALR
jgi:hypothetical protein